MGRGMMAPRSGDDESLEDAQNSNARMKRGEGMQFKRSEPFNFEVEVLLQKQF